MQAYAWSLGCTIRNFYYIIWIILKTQADFISLSIFPEYVFLHVLGSAVAVHRYCVYYTASLHAPPDTQPFPYHGLHLQHPDMGQDSLTATPKCFLPCYSNCFSAQTMVQSGAIAAGFGPECWRKWCTVFPTGPRSVGLCIYVEQETFLFLLPF